jgi:hypothetical protein
MSGLQQNQCIPGFVDILNIIEFVLACKEQHHENKAFRGCYGIPACLPDLAGGGTLL